MGQAFGIIVLAGLVALVFLLRGSDWPPAPTWMRLTAVALALALAGLAAVLVSVAADHRDGPGALVCLGIGAGAGLLALRVLAWACIGRMNPRWSLTAAVRATRPKR